MEKAHKLQKMLDDAQTDQIQKNKEAISNMKKASK